MPPAHMERILIIDDDAALCELVGEYLEPLGFTVEAVHRGDTGVERALHAEHDLILLDVMLPGQNGFEVLRQIRASSKVPVLMLTARGDDVDRIVGLEIGADDYLPKPFNPRELAARVRAILRRSNSRDDAEAATTLVVGDVEMELGTRLVRRSGKIVELTAVEFEVLEKLLRRPAASLLAKSCRVTFLGRSPSPFDRSIDMHISNLRKKLGHQIGAAERIRTVRGVGYIYAQPGVTKGA